MKKRYRVVIPPTAKESAARIRKELIQLAKSLNELPERFSKEEFLLDKRGDYHSVARWHYKIVYKILANEVVILRFLHTSRDPDLIKKIE